MIFYDLLKNVAPFRGDGPRDGCTLRVLWRWKQSLRTGVGQWSGHLWNQTGCAFQLFPAREHFQVFALSFSL